MRRKSVSASSGEQVSTIADISFGTQQEIVSLTQAKQKIGQNIEKDELYHADLLTKIIETEAVFIDLIDKKKKTEDALIGLNQKRVEAEIILSSISKEINVLKEKKYTYENEESEILSSFEKRKVSLEKAITTLEASYSERNRDLQNVFNKKTDELASLLKEKETLELNKKHIRDDIDALIIQKSEIEKKNEVVRSLQIDEEVLRIAIENTKIALTEIETEVYEKAKELNRKKELIAEAEKTLTTKASALETIDSMLEFRRRKQEVAEAKKLIGDS